MQIRVGIDPVIVVLVAHSQAEIVLSPRMAMPAPILAPWKFAIKGYGGAPDVTICAIEVDGGLRFTVTVDSSGGLTADLRGLFFNVLGDAPSSLEVSGADVTDYGTNTIDLGNGANMKGGGRSPYDVGVEIGTQGIGKDDIQSTSFFVPGLRLDDVYGQEFGARLTSVGSSRGQREGSAKLAQIAPGKTAYLEDGLSLGESKNDEELALKPIAQQITEGPEATVKYMITVSVPDLPELADILLTQDLTGSFSDDLSSVRLEFTGLFNSLNADDRDVAFGVASFVDKPFSPFGDAASGDYAYLTNQSISTSEETSQLTLNGLTTYNGVDGPEAQLEALVQIANRSGEVGWRTDAQRFVVISTDAPFHVAGDGQDVFSEWADNNGDGVIDLEDYPSIEQVKQALETADIDPIFAIHDEGGYGFSLIDYYEDFVTFLGRGAVVELSSDSSNLTAAILQGLREVTVDVVPTVLSDDFGLVQSVTPAGGYSDVDGPVDVNFEVTLTPSASYGSDEILIDFGDFGMHTISVDIAPSELLGSVGADVLTGNNATNALSGFGGNDQLSGNGGNDRLVGGKGDDILTGGLGRDIFAFAGGDDFDKIIDFESTGAGDLVDDVIEFAASSGLTTYGEVLAASNAAGSDLEIAYTGGVLTLKNTLLGDLASSNFTFL